MRLPSFQDLMPPSYLGNLDESFAWSLTRTDAMKLGRSSGELGNPDNAKKIYQNREYNEQTRECVSETQRGENSLTGIVVVVCV